MGKTDDRGGVMKGSEVFERLMNSENTVAISSTEAVRLHNFLKGMISVHDHVRKESDDARAKLAAMESQPPVGKVCKGASYIDSDFTASAKQSLQDGQKLYAKPVPVDKPAVAVAYTNQSGHLCGTGETIPPNTLLYMSTPSHSQQSAKYRCHKCGTETPEPEPFKAYVKCACGTLTAATAALVDDRCPSHESEKP